MDYVMLWDRPILITKPKFFSFSLLLQRELTDESSSQASLEPAKWKLQPVKKPA